MTIPLNQLGQHLLFTSQKKMLHACYYLEWIIFQKVYSWFQELETVA
nr:MAG TPA: hypothetical protein [Caudoviricetes sp.]